MKKESMRNEDSLQLFWQKESKGNAVNDPVKLLRKRPPVRIEE